MSALTQTLLPPLELPTAIRALHALLLPGKAGASGRDIPDGPAFELVEHAHADRATVESFIRARFAASYGCRIESFMPRLFSVRNRARTRGSTGTCVGQVTMPAAFMRAIRSANWTCDSVSGL